MQSDLVNATTLLKQTLKENHRWLLALGIGLILTGVFAIAAPFASTIGVVIAFGMLLLVAGLAQVFSVFNCRGWQGVVVHLLVGVLYCVTGFLILENPLEGAAGLTLLMSSFFFASGIMRMVVSFYEKFPGWGWSLLSGFVTFMLGVFVWKQFPESSLYTIGILIGVDLLFSGWAWVMISLIFKKIGESPNIEKHNTPPSNAGASNSGTGFNY